MTIPRRRLLLVALAGVALAGGVLYIYLLNNALWTSHADGITLGMTKEEVSRLLPRKPNMSRQVSPTHFRDRWDAIDGYIILTYDGNGRVNCIGGEREWMIVFQAKKLMTSAGF